MIPITPSQIYHHEKKGLIGLPARDPWTKEELIAFYLANHKELYHHIV